MRLSVPIAEVALQLENAIALSLDCIWC